MANDFQLARLSPTAESHQISTDWITRTALPFHKNPIDREKAVKLQEEEVSFLTVLVEGQPAEVIEEAIGGGPECFYCNRPLRRSGNHPWQHVGPSLSQRRQSRYFKKTWEGVGWLYDVSSAETHSNGSWCNPFIPLGCGKLELF